jgi:uncharacterized membrane protein
MSWKTLNMNRVKIFFKWIEQPRNILFGLTFLTGLFCSVFSVSFLLCISEPLIPTLLSGTTAIICLRYYIFCFYRRFKGKRR